jgi:hypothetical protein
MVRTAQLIRSIKEIDALADQIGRLTSQAYKRRRAILQYLIDNPGENDVASIFAASGGHWTDLTRLSDLGLISLSEKQNLRNPLREISNRPYEIPQLTSDQIAV